MMVDYSTLIPSIEAPILHVTQMNMPFSLYRSILYCYMYCLVSHVQLFGNPVNVACQAPLSMGFPRQKYWSGLPFPFPEDLPNPGIKYVSPALQVGSI